MLCVLSATAFSMCYCLFWGFYIKHGIVVKYTHIHKERNQWSKLFGRENLAPVTSKTGNRVSLIKTEMGNTQADQSRALGTPQRGSL